MTVLAPGARRRGAVLLARRRPGARGRRDHRPRRSAASRLATHGLVVDAPGATALPKVGASSYLLADLDTGEVLAAQRPARPAAPGEHAQGADRADAAAAAGTRRRLHRAVGGRQRRGQPGRRWSPTPPTPCTSCSRPCSWCRATTRPPPWRTPPAASRRPSAAMNATAKSLGALDTTVRNPSGLDAPGQYTSAYDLAVFARAAMARQDFRDYVTTVKAQFPGKMPKPGQGPQDLRDLHPGPAAAELPRRDRGQDRLDDQGPRHLRRRRHPRRPHAGRHGDAHAAWAPGATRPHC